MSNKINCPGGIFPNEIQFDPATDATYRVFVLDPDSDEALLVLGTENQEQAINENIRLTAQPFVYSGMYEGAIAL